MKEQTPMGDLIAIEYKRKSLMDAKSVPFYRMKRLSTKGVYDELFRGSMTPKMKSDLLRCRKIHGNALINDQKPYELIPVMDVDMIGTFKGAINPETRRLLISRVGV